MLALLALSLVIARPICEAYMVGAGSAEPAQLAASHHAGSDHSDGGPELCCYSIADGTLVGSTATAPGTAKYGSAFVIVRTDLQLAWSAPLEDRITSVPPDRPPFSPPYHARTARLLI
jgi:hypothetical protein